MKAGILLVEDDQFFAKVVKRHLERAGHEVTLCQDGEEGWDTFQQRNFDLCLLDIVMPRKDGFTLAQDIRSRDENTPIIFTSSRYMEQDRLLGFDVGADDYLVKPFNIEELLLRVDVFLKRSKLLQSEKRVQYNVGKLLFDYSELKILHAGTNVCVQLPPKEAELLRFLCENANKKLTRDYILANVWGLEDFFAGRSMDVYLTRLRKHFAIDPSIRMETFHGKGIMFVINDPEQVSAEPDMDMEMEL